MKIEIEHCNYGFYVKVARYINDYHYIVSLLNIGEEEFYNSIKSCNGYIIEQAGLYYPFFKEKEDVNSFLEYLQPYIIMKELIE